MPVDLPGIPSLPKAVIALVLLFFATLIARFVNKTSEKYFYRVTRRLRIDETTYVLFQRLMVALIYLFTLSFIVYMFESLRDLSYAILAGAGFAGVIVGFAAQSTLSNVISGLIIGMTRPFRVGDWIDIRGDYGTIEDITLRHTVIKTWDNRRLIIPNSLISTEIINNWTIKDPQVIWKVKFRIAPETDIDRAREIIYEEVGRTAHVIRHHEMAVYVSGFGDFYLELLTVFWVRDRTVAWTTGHKVREKVIKRFKKEGIEIPALKFYKEERDQA